MSKEINVEEKKRRRNLEFIALIMQVIGIPLISIIIAISIWVIAIPNSKYPELTYILIIVFIFFGFLFNTIQGNEFLNILKRYLKHQESQIDIEKTKQSYIVAIGTLLLIILLISVALQLGNSPK